MDKGQRGRRAPIISAPEVEGPRSESLARPSEALSEQLRRVSRQFVADVHESRVEIVGDRLHACYRGKSDQCNHESILDQILASFVCHQGVQPDMLC